ncbi:hypothetical protein [Leyella stercorea]|uniref:hypothetical protein n=1 Tax=Leyella stercorea TaxID=363265 RepID=UPI0024314228|nr:hypothetical protein [Leyella stercorea]
MILELVDKQYFVFLRHLILGDAMTKLGKKSVATPLQQHCHATTTTLPRYYNNIATLPQQHCHATATSLSQRGNNLCLGIKLI